MDTLVDFEKGAASDGAHSENWALSTGALSSSFNTQDDLSFSNLSRLFTSNLDLRLDKNYLGYLHSAHEVYDAGIIVKSKGKEFGSLFEGEILRTWKLVQNIPSQILSWDDEEILLECLIDRENHIYQERSFRRSVFEGYTFSETKKFLIQVYERPGEMKLEVLGKEGLVSEEDFPQINFEKRFGNIDLFKKSKKS